MSAETMGLFIVELRKSKQLTQKELAEQLNVSDKAVSKWERGLSYPDISLLTPLAEFFGVTATELLNGARAKDASDDVEAAVVKVLAYGETTVKRRIALNRSVAAGIVSLLLLIGIFVVLLVDGVTSGGFSWSLISVSACVFAWLVLFPVIKLGARGVRASLIAVSVLIVPFLYVLDRVIARLVETDGMVFLMGVRIAPLGVAFLWIAYLLSRKLRTRKLLTAAILVLLTGPLSYAVNAVVADMLHQPYSGVQAVINTIAPVMAAGILFIIEFVVEKGKNRQLL